MWFTIIISIVFLVFVSFIFITMIKIIGLANKNVFNISDESERKLSLKKKIRKVVILTILLITSMFFLFLFNHLFSIK